MPDPTPQQLHALCAVPNASIRGIEATIGRKLTPEERVVFDRAQMLEKIKRKAETNKKRAAITPEERERYDKWVSDAEHIRINQDQFAYITGLNTATISFALRDPEAPSMDMAKLRPALSCLRFICQRRLASGGKDREKLKDEKIKAEVELKQLEIQRVKNEMVSAEWAQREMETGYREQAAKTAAMFRSLPPLLAGRNVEDIARIMAEKKAELFADIAGMLPPEPEPKPQPKRKGGKKRAKTK